MNYLIILVQALVLITAPVTGDSLVGQVSITGTAASPQFDHYELAFAYDPNPTDTWFEVTPPSTSPVTNGPLGVWDTTNITDGVYMLRLRVYNSDSKAPVEVIVRNLKVSNNAPVAPTTEPGAPTALPGAPTATPGALTQPTLALTLENGLTPGATPSAGATAALTPSPQPTSNSPFASLPAFLDLSSYASAFCNGVYLTAAIFLVLAVYVIVRDRIRRPIRKWLRRVVSDIRKP
jgi:hypothetical protein